MQDVFLSEDDYRYYLENLNEWKQWLGCKIYAYCLMTNHVHLIIDPGSKATILALLMKRVAGRLVELRGRGKPKQVQTV